MTNSSYLKFIGVVLLLIVVALGIATAVVHSQFKDARNPEEKEMKRQHRKNLAISFLVFVAVWVMFLIVSNSLSKQKRSEIHPYTPTKVETQKSGSSSASGQEKSSLPLGSHNGGSPVQENRVEDAVEDVPSAQNISNLASPQLKAGDLKDGEGTRSFSDGKTGRVMTEKVCCRKNRKTNNFFPADEVRYFSAPKGFSELKLTTRFDAQYGKNRRIITKRKGTGAPEEAIVVAEDYAGIKIPVLKKDGDQTNYYIPTLDSAGVVDAAGIVNADPEKGFYKIKREDLGEYLSRLPPPVNAENFSDDEE